MDNKPKKIYKFKNTRLKENKVSEDEMIFREACVVAMHFTQYTLEDLINNVPLKVLNKMYREVNRRRAETLLLLNGVINGPNSKSKSKKEYKDIINQLSKDLEA